MPRIRFSLRTLLVLVLFSALMMFPFTRKIPGRTYRILTAEGAPIRGIKMGLLNYGDRGAPKALWESDESGYCVIPERIERKSSLQKVWSKVFGNDRLEAEQSAVSLLFERRHTDGTSEWVRNPGVLVERTEDGVWVITPMR